MYKLDHHRIMYKLILILILFMIIQPVYAQIKKYHYIAINQTPLYLNHTALPYANPNAPKGGEIRFSALGTFDNLNSMNGQGTAGEGIQHLYDSLMQSNRNEIGIMYPLLAESIEYDPNAPQFAIFNLNPKARFSDGSEVTADDVTYTFHTYLNQGAMGLKIYFSDLKNIRALSKYRVRFDFKTTKNLDMPSIVAGVSIMSKRDLQQREKQNMPFKQASLVAPIGSGAYRLGKVNAGKQIEYIRNPDYWAKDLMQNRGAYNFDRITYSYFRDEQIAFEAFKLGQFDIQKEQQVRRWATGYEFPKARIGQIKKIAFRHHYPLPIQSYILNTRRKPMDDIHFRLAMSYAYDFEWQNKALLYNQYQRLQSYFENSELSAKNTPNDAEMKLLKPILAQLSTIERKAVLKSWQYPKSDASGLNRYNLLVAYYILKNAGYHYNQKGQLLDQQQRPMRLEFLIHDDELQRGLLLYARHLKRLGIESVIRKVDMPQYIERKKNYDYDLIHETLPQSLNPSSEQKRFWGSQSAMEKGNYNFAGIQADYIDQTIEAIIQSKDRQTLITATKVLDRLLRAGYYQILTYGTPLHWYAYWNKFDYVRIQPKYSIAFEYWWSIPQQNTTQQLKLISVK